MNELFTILSEIVNFIMALGMLSIALDLSRAKKELREMKQILLEKEDKNRRGFSTLRVISCFLIVCIFLHEKQHASSDEVKHGQFKMCW